VGSVASPPSRHRFLQDDQHNQGDPAASAALDAAANAQAALNARDGFQVQPDDDARAEAEAAAAAAEAPDAPGNQNAAIQGAGKMAAVYSTGDDQAWHVGCYSVAPTEKVGTCARSVGGAAAAVEIEFGAAVAAAAANADKAAAAYFEKAAGEAAQIASRGPDSHEVLPSQRPS
jgi:hypothetical protein